jgi:hypothetical protein
VSVVLTMTVRKGTELGSGRKRAMLTDDVLVDVVLDERKAMAMVYRAVLNKRSVAVDGPLTAKVRRV